MLALFMTIAYPLYLNAADPSLALKVSMKQNVVDVSEAIEVRVELLNSGVESVRVYTNFILEDYFLRFDIEGPDGKRVQFLGEEYKLNPTVYTSVILEPRAFFGQVIDVREGKNMNKFNTSSKLYDLKKKGVYRLRAIYNTAGDKGGPWEGTLKSNELVFTIR